MKKLIIGTVVGTSLLIGGVVVAHSLEGRIERLQEQLGLNEEQTESARNIFEASHAKQEALQKEMRTLRKETQDQFEAVLNEEQLKKLEEMKDHRGKRGKGRGRGHRGRFMRADREGMPETFGHRAGPQMMDPETRTPEEE